MPSAAEQLASSVNFGAIAKATELKQRIIFTLLALIVYRLGTYIPIPGINPGALDDIFNQNTGGILGMFDMFAGGALSRMSIFALNIMPYISASIIIQLMSTASTHLAQLKKDGDSGRQKIIQYTRYGTVFLAAVQALGIATGLEGMTNSQGPAVDNPGIFFKLSTVITFIVFMERGQRRIIIQYPKRQVGMKIMGGQSSHLPLKINTAGVIPPIFASSILLLPVTALSINAGTGPDWLMSITALLGRGQPLYMLLYVSAIVFFAFFYTSIVFNAQDTADNLKNNGGFVPGIRPGEPTADYIDYVLTRLTVIGSAYLSAVCLLPEILISKYSVPFYLGGTSLLIVVTVTMDLVAQVHSHLIAHQYEGLIKKAKLRGRY